MPKQIPAGRFVELEHWGESRILLLINSASHIGIRSFFSGDLELSKEWFEIHFEENFEKVKDKYDPSLHTIDDYTQSIIDFALMDSNFCNLLSKFKSNLLAKWNEINNVLSEFKEKRWQDTNESGKRESFVNQCENFGNHVSNIIANIELLENCFLGFSEELLEKYDSRKL